MRGQKIMWWFIHGVNLVAVGMALKNWYLAENFTVG
jgi:hypothetical protein